MDKIDKYERKEEKIFYRIYGRAPELFYDISELDGLEDNEVTQKPLNEWIEELVEKDCSEK